MTKVLFFSISTAAAAAKSDTDAACVTDFIEIPGATTRAIAVAQAQANVAALPAVKLCGRKLNNAANMANSVEVCSK